MGKQAQTELLNGLTDRMWRKQTSWCWAVAPKPEQAGEIYAVILLDGIGIGSLVCLIARTPQAVTDWRWAGWESSNTWEKLLERQPAPAVVVCDGQKGILLAIGRVWPESRIQRCIFHVWQNIRVKLTLHPQTEAGRELLQLTRDLWKVNTLDQAANWQERLEAWHARYENFVRERTYVPEPKARPIFHHLKDSIEAHLTIVMAALAIGKAIEQRTGLSKKKFVNTLKPIRSGVVTINGIAYPTEPEISTEIKQITQYLKLRD